MNRVIPVNSVPVVLACLLISGLLFANVMGIRPAQGLVANAFASVAATKTRIDRPQIFCASSTQTSVNITVCAPNSGSDSTGLPAGFSLQWMTCADFTANGNQWFSSDDPRLCKASFSGNATSSRYRIAPGECVTVNVGNFLFDEGASTNCAGTLQCGTCYVFRAFGHATSNLNRSEFANNQSCSTLDCDSECDDSDQCEFCNCCLIDVIHWPTEGPPGCASFTRNNWPVTSLTLGTVTYTDFQLCQILNTPANGNGLITLAQELIAAKLNQASIIVQLRPNGVSLCSGATCEQVAMINRWVADADALVGGQVIPPLGTGFLDPTVTDSSANFLHTFNRGDAWGWVDGCLD